MQLKNKLHLFNPNTQDIEAGSIFVLKVSLVYIDFQANQDSTVRPRSKNKHRY